MNDEFFSVSELNNFIKDVINAGFPQNLWVCGEIQGFDRNKSKSHIFFELVEKGADSKSITAKIGLVIFSNRKEHIQKILKDSDNGFELKDDIEVKFSCKVDFYAPHGAVRLIVESIDPVYTLGKLAVEKQKLIVFLTKNGTLEKNKQLALPIVPLTIGLITSDDSAAFNDFRSELQKSGFAFKVFLRNTLMQGSKTEKDVCDAINELHAIKGIDVIVITRGGGSLADLSFFDSRMIAEKIAVSQIPVLSGIGHEINVSITDMAAHTHAKTPTAIAQFLVNTVSQYLGNIDESLARILTLARQNIESQKQRLKSNALRLQHATLQYLRDHQEQLIRFSQILKDRPANRLVQSREILNQNSKQLMKIVLSRVADEKTRLNHFKKMVDSYHPVRTMKRGFSITRNGEGQILRSVRNVQENETLTTELSDGKINSKVETIKRGKENGG